MAKSRFFARAFVEDAASGRLAEQYNQAVALGERLKAQRLAQEAASAGLDLRGRELDLRNRALAQRTAEFEKTHPLSQFKARTGRMGAENTAANTALRREIFEDERSPESLQRRAQRRAVDVARDPVEAARIGNLGQDEVLRMLKAASGVRRRKARQSGATETAKQRARVRETLGRDLMMEGLRQHGRRELIQERSAAGAELAGLRARIKNALSLTGVDPTQADRMVDEILAGALQGQPAAPPPPVTPALPGAGGGGAAQRQLTPEQGQALRARLDELMAAGVPGEQALAQAMQELGLQ